MKRCEIFRTGDGYSILPLAGSGLHIYAMKVARLQGDCGAAQLAGAVLSCMRTDAKLSGRLDYRRHVSQLLKKLKVRSLEMLFMSSPSCVVERTRTSFRIIPQKWFPRYGRVALPAFEVECTKGELGRIGDTLMAALNLSLS